MIDAKPLKQAIREGRLHTITVWVVCVLLAISFGLSYGSNSSNHSVYLIEGIRQARDGFLGNDWWATETFQYHARFSWLVRLGEYTGGLPYLLAGLNMILIAVSMYAIYRICHLSLRGGGAIVAWLLCLTLFFGLQDGRSVGASYLFSNGLQPSTIGAAGTLLALRFFAEGRYLLSGVMLALGGAFHANFLILGAAVFAGAHIVLFEGARIRRIASQLLPSLVVIALEFPVLIAVSADPSAAEGRDILMKIAAPYHYVPRTFLVYFIPLAAWGVMGLSAARWSDDSSRRLTSVFLSLIGLLAVGVLGTVVVEVPTVAQLFVWRFAPVAILVAQILLATALVRVVLGQAPAEPFRKHWWRIVLFVVGFGILSRFFLYLYSLSHFRFLALIGVSASLGLVLFWQLGVRRGAGWSGLWPVGGRTLALGVVFACLLSYTTASDLKPEDFNLSSMQPPAQEAALYAWARSTPGESVFLIPPSMGEFRLWAERAAIVSWKAVPVKPTEVLEWYRRVCDIAGKKVVSAQDAEAAYRTMTAKRLMRLTRQYHIDYAVFPLSTDVETFDAPIVFETSYHRVLAF